MACVNPSVLAAGALWLAAAAACGGDPPAPARPALAPYTETIPGTRVSFDMIPIPGGRFLMGSPPDEPGRGEAEGPQHEVEVEPFWIGRCEVTWDEYALWAEQRDLLLDDPAQKLRVDGVSRPTPAYTDMTFGMGREGHPAISMTQHAARTYCEWLSKTTGRAYRLPTEAEWEYACRAGTTTAYGFGDDPAQLERHAWSKGNSEEKSHPVGTKEPNAFGLCDMHGNVAEWVLDRWFPDGHRPGEDPFAAAPSPKTAHVVRGGSWADPPELLRSAARRGSTPAWQAQDPQMPKSVWYLTDAKFVGFRVVRPAGDR
jgi:formylglycine-generating enzyme required for sulfatase activity